MGSLFTLVPHPLVSLIPEYVSLRPGTTFRVAVRIELPDGWHIGWNYPGQSGLATGLDWRISTGVTHDSTAWPYPERWDSIGIVANVYRGNVLLVSRFSVRDSASSGAVDLVADLHWGICREMCTPQEHRVRISLPVGRGLPESSARWGPLVAILRERLPSSPDDVSLEARRVLAGIRVSPIRGQQRAALTGGEMIFFPESSDHTVAAIVVEARATPTGLLIPLPSIGGAALRGVLVANQSWGAGPERARALRINLPA